jgi:putative hydrolase of the HAD superfamily
MKPDRPALLFDLDETLIVEEPAAEAAFLAVAERAVTRHDLDSRQLALDARRLAGELWYAAPTIDYCLRVGISSWEGLWCAFEAEGAEARRLRTWGPTYRAEAWALALAQQGVDDRGLALELGERFGVERRGRHHTFEDAATALTELGREHRLALLTNGASCLQREKLAASGLAGHFEAVVVSEDVGEAKPAAAAFEAALAAIGAEPAGAVMIGDSIGKDVDGALALGIRAVWLNRSGTPRPAGRDDLNEIRGLDELPAALADLPAAAPRRG